MSKPVFSDLFSFDGRRNRKSYLLHLLLLQVPLVVLAFVLGMKTKSDLGGIAALVVFLLFYAVTILAAIQRFNDIGWPGWFGGIMLLLPLGYVALPALLLVKGKADVGQTEVRQAEAAPPEQQIAGRVHDARSMASLLDRLPSVLDPRRRRNRLAYLSFNLIVVSITVVFAIAIYIVLTIWPDLFDFKEFISGFDRWWVSGLVALPHLVPMAQRCRDINWPGWAALLIFVPFLGETFWLALFFIPGTRGPNRYGPDPLAPAAPKPD